MNSLSFSTLNLVNPEPIEWPLNSVFTNKYDKIRCWPRNYEYLWEFTNSLIPFFQLCYYSLIFGLLRISIGLSVFRFVANEYKQITIYSLSTIRNIWSGIWWEITKVILNYSTLPNPLIFNSVQKCQFWFGIRVISFPVCFQILNLIIFSSTWGLSHKIISDL